MAKHAAEIYLSMGPTEDGKRIHLVGHLRVDGLVIGLEPPHEVDDKVGLERMAEYCERAAASLRAVSKRQRPKEIKS